MPDVTIIGAGPAGSVAALLLARYGWRVTVVEQHVFPRDKVCGECISALGIDVLHSAGAAAALRALDPVVLTHAIIHAADGNSVRLPLPRPMWGLSRGLLDSTLLSLARAAGVAVLQPARCERIEPSTSRSMIHVRNLATNRRESWSSDQILLADGKAALLPSRPARTKDFGIKAHFAGIDGPRDAIELFGVRGHYGGIAPVEEGRWNVAFSVPASLLEEFRGDLDALFAGMLKQNCGLASRLANACRVGDWLSSPLPRFAVARQWPPGIIPIGNAAAAVEPIGGEGMGLAMRSAELAAEFLGVAGPRKSRRSLNPLRKQFGALWRSRRLSCRAAAGFMSQPEIAAASVDWIAASDQMARAVLYLIGKA